jgi:hypothetical protein
MGNFQCESHELAIPVQIEYEKTKNNSVNSAALRAATGTHICSRVTRNPTVRWSYSRLNKRVLFDLYKVDNAGVDGLGENA